MFLFLLGFPMGLDIGILFFHFFADMNVFVPHVFLDLFFFLLVCALMVPNTVINSFPVLQQQGNQLKFLVIQN
jgi:hypothetical protein